MSTEEFSPRGRPILSCNFIDKLIEMPKFIPAEEKDPFKIRVDNGHMRSSVPLVSDEPNCIFTFSTRRLIRDPSDFSVVFIYIDPCGREYIIRRYNNDHGRHFCKATNQYITAPHIHTITEKAQRDYHKDETEAIKTDRYETLEEAIDFAMLELNIGIAAQSHTSIEG